VFLPYLTPARVRVAELNLYVGQLTPEQKSSPAVQHALGVQRAVALGNYHALFEYYLSAPNMGAYIMDHFIDRERLRALLTMTKACVRTSSAACSRDADLISPLPRYQRLPLAFVTQELAFESVTHAREFLAEHRAAAFVDPRVPDAEMQLDCRTATAELGTVYEEKYRKVQIKGAI